MRGQSTQGFVLPKPGRALKTVMLVVFGVWLVFAIGVNWAGLPSAAFYVLCGNQEGILRGELWRLVSAPLMHVPSGSIGHIITTLLGMYFLGPSLEQEWGSRRFLRFLASSAILAYLFQFLVALTLPDSLRPKLVPEFWFGGLPVIEAIAIAWAMSFKGRTVYLMFVLPVSSRGLIIFVVVMSLMYLIVGAQPPAGHIAPFAGMGLGWLLGGGSPSPLRRWYLKFRLAQLEAETKREGKERKHRVAKSGLKVIHGGKPDDDDDDPPKMLN